jgi:hypothetical protein
VLKLFSILLFFVVMALEEAAKMELKMQFAWGVVGDAAAEGFTAPHCECKGVVEGSVVGTANQLVVCTHIASDSWCATIAPHPAHEQETRVVVHQPPWRTPLIPK